MSRARGCSVLIVSLLLSLTAGLAASPVYTDPIYVKIENGWTGLFPHNDEYARFSLKGADIKLQDAYHALLPSNLGMMLTFADKKNFANSEGDLLATHARWELEYWQHHAARVESANRDDLKGARTDIRVTEFKLYSGQGAQVNMYCLALASKDGVFVLSISGPAAAAANGNIDSLLKETADSFKLVSRALDADELKRVSLEIKSESKAQ